MKGSKYTKTLAKIWVRGMYRIRDIRGNVLPKFIGICLETPWWCAHLDGHQHGGRKPTETSVTVLSLLQKREFISRGAHKH